MHGVMVSVIVSVYNVEAYLERAVRSILAQTYAEIEIVLVDDGSTDASGALCDRLAAAHACVSAVHKQNGGLSSARNYGIRHSHGEWLMFVDADDTIHAQTVEKLVQAGTSHACDIVFCGAKRIYVSNAQEIDRVVPCVLKASGAYDSVSYAAHLRRDSAFFEINFDSACNKLFKREVFAYGLFPEHVKYVEDNYFWLTLLRQPFTFYYVNEPLYYYYNYDKAARACLTNSSLSERFTIYKQLYLMQQEILRGKVAPAVEARCKHYFASKVILACVLLARADAPYTDAERLAILQDVVEDPVVIDALGAYARAPGHSWTLPLLLRKKAVPQLLYFAKKRARARYGA